MIHEWNGINVTVMGLGLFGGGVGATRWLLKQGARVTVTDLKSSAELGPSVRELEGEDICWRLGEHRLEDFTEADAVVVSPAVPKSSGFLRAAYDAGRTVTSEMNLFLQRCPASVTGITGSNGKTTTTSLTYAALEQTKPGTLMGGNVGRSLLSHLDSITEKDWVVLELSSFQLEDMARERLGVDIAVVTNLTPNHLDRHGSFEAYTAAKQNIIRFLKPGGRAVLNADDRSVSSWGKNIPNDAFYFSLQPSHTNGAFIRDGCLTIQTGGDVMQLLAIEELPLKGPHNVSNALAAAMAAHLAGADANSICRGFHTVTQLEHRMELVKEEHGIRFYNDSKATTPEAAMASLNSFDSPVILLAGGYDKQLPLDSFAREISKRASQVILMGQSANTVKNAVVGNLAREHTLRVRTVDSLETGVDLARRSAREGDVVLLSPGFASYGMFNNYEERGRRFRELVLGS